MSEVSVHELEKQKKDLEKALEERELALKLYKNPEFKKLILDTFCTKECARYAQESADPALSPEQRADALAMAQAAGHLRRFLSVKVTLGNQAERLMPELDLNLVEARQEEND